METGERSSVKSTRRAKEDKKILRKQIKASHTLLKHEGISTTPRPSKSLVVANGGLGNSVSREELTAALEEVGEVEALVMPPHKPYAFGTYSSEDGARKAHDHLNGHKLRCGDDSVTLYLSYVDSVSCEEEKSSPLPEGLVLVDDFVSPEEEATLLAAIDWSSTTDDVTAQKSLKHRRVKHYGFEFRYDNNNVDKDKPLPAGLPEECLPVLQRCVRDGHVDTVPDQLTVNQYESGQGIPPHVDTHSAFEDTIMSLSLGAQTVMEFRHPDGRLVPVLLPGRSLLVMKGESRFLWSHGITPRKFDMVPIHSDPQSPDVGVDLTLSRRGTRTSFTFRKIRHEPCCCAFASACDSQGAACGPSPAPPPSAPSLPCCHVDATRLEEEYVHRVYDTIASHFSSTRHSPWPRVCHFLSALSPGSVLADVGCGNGKYLGVIRDVFAMGSDRSAALVQICAERGFQSFVSDALSVPLRTASCDACISIAVIHHFSTQERRLAAVRELVRLLKPGGRALIYVWAFEQEFNKQKSKYLRDQSTETDGEQQPQEKHGAVSRSSAKPRADAAVDGKLSIHTNRTAFNTQDLLVPWHLKEGKTGGGGGAQEVKQNKTKDLCKNTPASISPKPDPDSGPAPVFHRYYHVFQQGELEQLCAQVAGVRVQTSYHDQGNWCVILERD